MDEFACVTLAGNEGESEAAFKSRLVAFWSDYIRTKPDEYERIYAEATKFETDGNRVTRQYLVQLDGIDPLLEMLAQHQIHTIPVDRDDLYSKYEATAADWFQLSH